METTNKTSGKTEKVGSLETNTKKINAPSVFEVKTQKKKLVAEKDRIDAIYFDGNKRLLTYSGISYQMATLELIQLQNIEHKAITMIVLKEDTIPVGMTSWERSDYMKYIVTEEDN